MRVGVISRALDNAATRVRIAPFVEPLGRQGIEVRVLPWEPRSLVDSVALMTRGVRLARWADVVVLQKPRLPERSLDVLARVNPAIVVDVDDAVWTWGPTVSDRFSHAISRARVVVAGSQHLATRIGTMTGCPVEVVRSVADADRYRPGVAPRTPRPPGPVVVGWIGTSGSFGDFSPDVVGALAEVVGSGLITVRIVSSELPELDGVGATFVPWSAESEVASLQGIDIGVMPLVDDERSRGRCAYKAVQHMAVGAPVVASPVGAASEVVLAGRTGLMATTPDQWVDQLSALATDTPWRAQLAETARAHVVENLSVASAVPRWVEILERATSR